MKNKIKENKLIAEFMGFQKTTEGWFDNEGTLGLTDNTFDELLFHTWNWLIPVISKIASTEPEFFGGAFQTTAETLEDSLWENNIKKAYDEVCEFIISYNKHKQ